MALIGNVSATPLTKSEAFVQQPIHGLLRTARGEELFAFKAR
jgi:hypothetical protein